MTRKDYIRIADAMLSARNEARGANSRVVLDIAVDNLAWTLEQDNPRFDRARFLTACGVEHTYTGVQS